MQNPRLHLGRVLAVLPLAALPLSAQDDCAQAVPVTLGVNGPFTNAGATLSTPAWTCPPNGGADVWYSYTANLGGFLTVSLCGADYDAALEVFDGTAGCNSLMFLACNDDFCGVDPQLTVPVNTGGTYYIRVGGFSSATGNFPLELSLDLGLSMVGVSEILPNTSPLGAGGGFFRTGDFLRWNFADPFGHFAGDFGAVAVNFGVGGSAPLAMTPAIPGFEQTWSGSNPSGAVDVLGPNLVGAPDFFVFVPPGLFNVGDTVRIQGIVLSSFATGALPAVATSNLIEWENGLCVVGESFEGLSGTGTYPAGWANGGGTWEWQGGQLGTPSSGTGPSSATHGSTYFYCETSSPVVQGDTFIMDTAVYASGSLTSNTLAFDLSRVGIDIDTLEVLMDDGSGAFATTLAVYTGPEPSGTEWTNEVINLPTPLPMNFQVRFRYTRGPGFQGDVAIDNLCLQ